MTDHNQALAALVASRICHDLISPVGAMQNGVELLAMEGRGGPELSLIEDSVRNASARIRFLRIAFGMAAPGQGVAQGEIRQTLADMSHAGRVRYDWPVSQDCPRSDAQQVFLAMMCLEAAMPRGGTIVATQDGGGWAVTGPAARDRPDPALWQQLLGEGEPAEVRPAHVQFPLLAALIRGQGHQLELRDTDTGLTIRMGGRS